MAALLSTADVSTDGCHCGDVPVIVVRQTIKLTAQTLAHASYARPMLPSRYQMTRRCLRHTSLQIASWVPSTTPPAFRPILLSASDAKSAPNALKLLIVLVVEPVINL